MQGDHAKLDELRKLGRRIGALDVIYWVIPSQSCRAAVVLSRTVAAVLESEKTALEFSRCVRAAHQNQKIVWDRMWAPFPPPRKKAQHTDVSGLTLVTPTRIELVLSP